MIDAINKAQQEGIINYVRNVFSRLRKALARQRFQDVVSFSQLQSQCEVNTFRLTVNEPSEKNGKPQREVVVTIIGAFEITKQH